MLFRSWEALEVAKIAQDVKSQKRYRNYLLKLFTIWEKWEKGAVVYHELKNETDGYSRNSQMEFLSTLQVLDNTLFTKDLDEDLKKLLDTKNSPNILYCKGLSYLKTDLKKAIEYFKRAEAAFLSSHEHHLRILLSIVPFVWGNYAKSLQENKNIFSKEIVQKIYDKMKHYYSLNDLQEPLENHLKKWDTIGQNMDSLKRWCYEFRKLICW